MKRRFVVRSKQLAAAASAALVLSDCPPFVSGFSPAPVSFNTIAQNHGTSRARFQIRAALSPDDVLDGSSGDPHRSSLMTVSLVDNNNSNTDDDESFIESLNIEDDPLQNLLNTSSNLRTNELINIGILTAVTVAALSALLTVDLAGGITRGWSATEVAARIPLDDWAYYNDILQTHPVLTKAATSATVYGIGDIIAQNTEGKDLGDLDRGRVTRSLLAGLIGHGPLSHVWYIVSENFFDNVAHLTAWWSVFPKIVVDQLIWGPIWTSVYLLMTGIMQRDQLRSIGENIQKSIVPLTVSGLKLWPAAHIVTYGLLPIDQRLLWVDAVEIVWVTILATQAAGLAEAAADEEETSSTVESSTCSLAAETR